MYAGSAQAVTQNRCSRGDISKTAAKIAYSGTKCGINKQKKATLSGIRNLFVKSANCERIPPIVCGMSKL